jgi:hypothetical protein
MSHFISSQVIKVHSAWERMSEHTCPHSMPHPPKIPPTNAGSVTFTFTSGLQSLTNIETRLSGVNDDFLRKADCKPLQASALPTAEGL